MNSAVIFKYVCWEDKSLAVGVACSAGFGAFTAALLSLFSGLLLGLLGPANMGALAGAATFAHGWIFTFFAAVIWAPLWETLIGQLIPIGLLTRLGAGTLIAVLGSAALFSIGHVASGGGLAQGLVTLVAGLLLATLFAANARSGLRRASLFTCIAHATNNAILISLSFGLDL